MDGTKAPMKLKGYLAENGIKQQEIADLLGIDVKNVNQKLNGNQSFTLEQAVLICNHFGISMDTYFSH